jgi:HD-GYP domain-containing protein (c-di-GMP phosphodiesterase class II)
VPLEARIIAVADVWDALTSDRVYRKAMSTGEARSILIAERGSKLDEHCVDALLAIIEQRSNAFSAMEPAVPAALSMAAAG